jgi:hypothetical protein
MNELKRLHPDFRERIANMARNEAAKGKDVS